jgi:hypothetical protein
MRSDIGHAQPHQIVQRHAQPDLLHDAGGAGLELHRRVVPGDGVAGDLADHVAAAQEGAHLGLPVAGG